MKLWILACFCGLIFQSCMKAPEVEEGTEASKQDVAEALIKGWGSTDLYEIAEGDFHSEYKSVQISTLLPQTTLQKGLSVTKIDDISDPDYRTITMVIQAVEYLENNQSKPSTRSRIVSIPKQQLQNTNALLHEKADEQEIKGTPFETFIFASQVCGQEGVKCYNLTSEKTVEPVPDLVQQQPNCLGFANCQLPVTNIKFDLIYTHYDEASKTTVKTKIIYQLKFTEKAPFLARLLQFCSSGMVTVEQQKLPVTICQTVDNFKFGAQKQSSTTPFYLQSFSRLPILTFFSPWSLNAWR